jgi:hypothetical protein
MRAYLSADHSQIATPDLPPPNSTLRFLTVGHGIQNYTCSAAGANATAAGALATLWDISHLYPGSGPAALSWVDWVDLPTDVLRLTFSPLNVVGTPENQFGAVKGNPFGPDNDLVLGANTLPFLGHHTFDEKLVPTFEFFASGALFKGGRLAGVKAPMSSDPGFMNTGAVDWLALNNNAGLSRGLSLTYRVITAGGNPLPCTAAGQSFSIPYASQYWFYA